ncbi:MAG TPA: hypothetical protein PLD27_13115 [bacterium]|nr:hypothetical protein [bacterium]HPQ19736.1 hypothetical protein [bacterium]
MNWAKNNPEIYEIARILNENAPFILSLQSLDEEVLKNVKRSNIKLNIFKDIIKKCNADNIVSGTEIMLGLPGETYQSHIDNLKKLFDWDVSYIICYYSLVIKGCEISNADYLNKFQIKTKYRLIDSSFGKYEDFYSFEYERGILETNTITYDEMISIRPIHWLIQFLWNYRCNYLLLNFLKKHNINPMDVILKLFECRNSAPEKLKQIFIDFIDESHKEWFDSYEKMREYYINNFDDLQNGKYGKLNGKYIWRVLLEAKNEFAEYIKDITQNLLPEKSDVIAELVRFENDSIIDFSDDFENIFKPKIIEYQYNFLEWFDKKFIEPINNFKEKINILFSLSEERIEDMKKLLKQYEHKNKNVTLRKVSERVNIRLMFYDRSVYKE